MVTHIRSIDANECKHNFKKFYKNFIIGKYINKWKINTLRVLILALLETLSFLLILSW